MDAQTRRVMEGINKSFREIEARLDTLDAQVKGLGPIRGDISALKHRCTFLAEEMAKLPKEAPSKKKG
jgi:hypothetical protein